MPARVLRAAADAATRSLVYLVDNGMCAGNRTARAFRVAIGPAIFFLPAGSAFDVICDAGPSRLSGAAHYLARYRPAVALGQRISADLLRLTFLGSATLMVPANYYQ